MLSKDAREEAHIAIKKAKDSYYNKLGDHIIGEYETGSYKYMKELKDIAYLGGIYEGMYKMYKKIIRANLVASKRSKK